ncbi:AMP-binding protein [Candidatus Sulfidibacterium hydrothermale]|uniref:AMP-binding protein n=1 Tax=Candidatus Sulfidibacterium hydrothermale TaxID=2875962 RepID=UPI001F0A081C|nr:AMP-binding protein [Candidatus Sulfidibacterium hydrothermale]UBM62666.1 AMP-binding protein [Candidatus Sulfidibacterium hydrothermale]
MKNFVVHQLLHHAVITYPEQEIISGNTRLTFKTFYDRVVKLANSLSKRGVKKGTVLGVLEVNTHRFLELHYASSMLGAVLHTINFRLAPEQMVYSMKHAGDEWVFVSELFAPAIKPILSQFPNWVYMGEDKNEELSDGSHHFFLYESLIEEGEKKEPDFAKETNEKDIFSIFYTTGTTGKPKGIRYTHHAILHGAIQLFHHLAMHKYGARVSSRDVYMPLIPFFHIHAWGMAFFPLYIGAKLVLPGAADPAHQLELIKREKVSWMNMVPTQLQMLLNQEGFENIKVLTGGSPFASGIAQQAHRAGIQFSLIYGGSDQLATAISVVPENVDPSSPEAMEWRRVGMRPLPLVEISIKDKEGKEVPHDGKTLGSVWVRSPWLPEGYYKEPEITKEHFIDGWFRTGDLGFFYENHSLYVADREGDAIKSGGEWIPTGMLEAVISEYPAVEQVAVIPEKNEQWGQRPLAVIKATEKVTGQQLSDFLLTKVKEGKLAKFWIPDNYLFVDEIPLTSAGKLNKKALRKQYGN